MGTISTTKMSSKTKKKKFDSVFGSLQHRFSPFRHLISVRAVLVLMVLASCLTGAPFAAAPAFQSSSSSGSRAHDFLIFTTVFSDKGFALYGARTRLRRAEEKKYRWEAMSDHSGELAFRVPQGAEYEMTIEAKGFKTQTRKIDARDNIRADLTIRLEPLSDSPAAPRADAPNGGKP
jgi:hypothetical protein